MSDDDQHSGENSLVGRTSWDLIYDVFKNHRTLALSLLGGVVFVVVGIAYITAGPGEPVTVFGVEWFRKSSSPSVTDKTVEEPRQQADASRPEQPENALELPESSSRSLITAKTVEELRQQTGVRQLEQLESGLELSKLPNGRYGFIKPWDIGDDRLSLNRFSFGPWLVEIHKSTPEGRVYVIGYLSRESLVRLRDPTRNDPIQIMLFVYPAGYEIPAGHQIPVAIHSGSIISSDSRLIQDDDGGRFYINDMAIR